MHQHKRRTLLLTPHTALKTCALIPTYNNVTTIANVVTRTLRYLPVIVVTDGSTDGTAEAVEQLRSEPSAKSRLYICHLPHNCGKGTALQKGFHKATELGFTHVVTLDADGQHNPDDLPRFLRLSSVRPEAIIVGSRTMQQVNKPRKNTFANRFSNFWFALQTGLLLPDTQSGYRVYPLAATHGIACMTRRYEAELLLLVLSAWASTPIVPLPIEAYYPPEEERVSFFRPGKDFTRISILNTLLCILALIYGLPRRYWRLAYWGFCFFCYAFCGYLFSAIHALNPSPHKDEQLRRALGVSTRMFLNLFPGPRIQYRLAKDATPIDKNQPAVYIANHTSLMDILIFLTLHQKMVVIGKNSIIHNIFYGRVAKAFGVITLNNGIEQMVPALQNYVQRGYSIAVFPEGTRSLDSELLRFHRGAFFLAEELHLPIRPLLFRGLDVAFPKMTLHVGKPKEMSVTILPLISPEDTSFGTDYRERTRQIRAYYHRLIATPTDQIPLSANLSHEDSSTHKGTKIILLFLTFSLSIGIQAAAPNSLRPTEKGTRARVTLTPYLPDSSSSPHCAIIICPGGSYSWHDMQTEGEEVAQWLQGAGINAYVLKYRVATVGAYITGFRMLGIGNKYPDMLEDIEDALRYVYEHAEQDHTDTMRIGVMGFSAGGHLTMMSYLYNRTPYRPTFLCPIYPVVSMSAPCSHTRSRRGALGVWGQWNNTMRDSLSIEKHVTCNCPPVFLVNCADDPVVAYHNSELLDSALTAQQVPHLYLQYQTGGHGFGASDRKGTEECRQWKASFLQWLQTLSTEGK